MKKIAIIPARGGSKRIPKKNIKDFIGKPIISYSISAALSSNLFDEVIVSTDDAEIAEIAIKYGASVPFFRSEKNANDYASTFDVIEEVVLKYKIKNIHFEYICCIYPCAPFVNSKKITDAFNLIKEKNFDSVFPIISFSFPIQRALKIIDDKIDFLYPQQSLVRSQDLEPSYHDAGQFYWMRTEKIMTEKKILTSNSGGILISEMEGQDIDNETDWKLAQLKYKLMQD